MRHRAEKRPQDVIDDLAHRVRRLRPDHRDPHRFHEEKSEIAHELSKLARVLPAGGRIRVD